TPIPQPGQFLAVTTGIKPISITTMLYGPDGGMTERREYDVTWSGTGNEQYQATFTYTGMGGATVFSQSPGQPVQVSTLDGLGRVASTRSVVPRLSGSTVLYDFEMSRTDNHYDADNNLERVTHWERIVDANAASPAQAALDATNAVASMTLNWHD